MSEHAQEMVPLLLWMIVVVGAALLGLVIWIGKRLQDNVDKLPTMISTAVKAVHDEILTRIDKMNNTHKDLERDVRTSLAALDRRVISLEVRCDLQHPRNVIGNGGGE